MSFEVLWPETLSLGGGGWQVRDGVNPRCEAVGRVWPAAVGDLCDRSSFRGSAKVRYGSEGGRGLWERVLSFVAWHSQVDAGQSEPRHQARVRSISGRWT